MENSLPEPKPKLFPRNWFRLFAVVLVALIGIAFISASMPIEEKEAQEIIDQAKQVLPQKVSVDTIFLNNFRATLLMIIPGFGAVLAGIIIYNTGLVFGATGITMNISGPLLLLAVALTPFFWFEFLSYAAGVTEGTYLLRGIIRKRARSGLRRTGVVIGIMAIFLLLGAAIEVLFIRAS